MTDVLLIVLLLMVPLVEVRLTNTCPRLSANSEPTVSDMSRRSSRFSKLAVRSGAATGLVDDNDFFNAEKRRRITKTLQQITSWEIKTEPDTLQDRYKP